MWAIAFAPFLLASRYPSGVLVRAHAQAISAVPAVSATIATSHARSPVVAATLSAVKLRAHVLSQPVFPARFAVRFLFCAPAKLTSLTLSVFRARVLFVGLQAGSRVRFDVGVRVRAAAPTPVHALFSAIYQVPIHAQALLIFRVLSFASILSHVRTLADVLSPDLSVAKSAGLAPSLSLSHVVVVSFLARLLRAFRQCAGLDRNQTSRVVSFWWSSHYDLVHCCNRSPFHRSILALDHADQEA